MVGVILLKFYYEMPPIVELPPQRSEAQANIACFALLLPPVTDGAQSSGKWRFQRENHGKSCANGGLLLVLMGKS